MLTSIKLHEAGMSQLMLTFLFESKKPTTTIQQRSTMVNQPSTSILSQQRKLHAFVFIFLFIIPLGEMARAVLRALFLLFLFCCLGYRFRNRKVKNKKIKNKDAVSARCIGLSSGCLHRDVALFRWVLLRCCKSTTIILQARHLTRRDGERAREHVDKKRHAWDTFVPSIMRVLLFLSLCEYTHVFLSLFFFGALYFLLFVHEDRNGVCLLVLCVFIHA